MIITNLLTNMVVLARCGAALTNTPQFHAYAYREAAGTVSALAVKWHLPNGLGTAVGTNAVSVTPYPDHYVAVVEAGPRFTFRIFSGQTVVFADKPYCEQFALPMTNLAAAANGEDAWLRAIEREQTENTRTAKRWAAGGDLLTMTKARRLAESALQSSGVPINEVGFGARPHATQAVWEEKTGQLSIPAALVATNGIGEIVNSPEIPECGEGPVRFAGPFGDGFWIAIYPLRHPVKIRLPYYKFRWESARATCDIHVSGLTSNIVYFDYNDTQALPPLPTNYFRLLNLPPEPVFVKRRFGNPTTYQACEDARLGAAHGSGIGDEQP